MNRQRAAALRVTPEHVRTRTFEFERDHGDFAAAAGVDCDANGAIALYAGGHFRHADGFRLSVCAAAHYDPSGSSTTRTPAAVVPHPRP